MDNENRLSIRETQCRWEREFAEIGDEFDKYTYLMALGKELRGIPEEERTEGMRFADCLSNVWICLKADKGRIFLQADSDTLIVRGILFLLEDLLDKRPLKEAADEKITLLEKLGLESVFNSARRRGMDLLLAKIREFAKNAQEEWGKERDNEDKAAETGRTLQGN